MGERKFIDVLSANGYHVGTLPWCVVMVTLPRKPEDAPDEHRLTFAVVARGRRIRFPFCVCQEFATRKEADDDLKTCQQEFLH